MTLKLPAKVSNEVAAGVSELYLRFNCDYCQVKNKPFVDPLICKAEAHSCCLARSSGFGVKTQTSKSSSKIYVAVQFFKDLGYFVGSRKPEFTSDSPTWPKAHYLLRLVYLGNFVLGAKVSLHFDR